MHQFILVYISCLVLFIILADLMLLIAVLWYTKLYLGVVYNVL